MLTRLSTFARTQPNLRAECLVPVTNPLERLNKEVNRRADAGHRHMPLAQRLREQGVRTSHPSSVTTTLSLKHMPNSGVKRVGTM